MTNGKAVCLALGLTVSFAACATGGPPETPSGPLRVHPENQRYFADAEGKPVYLTGSHVWTSLIDYTHHAPMDFDAYLDFLQEHNHNFIRLWVTENSSARIPGFDRLVWWTPLAYPRTGPGLAVDGKPKYDLAKFNPAFFDRLRFRAEEAGRRGFYMSIMLFQGWSLGKDEVKDLDTWMGHPFNKDNNINRVDGDPNADGQGLECHTLELPEITRLQERYLRKVIDVLNDLDHIVWEISNESHKDSVQWQYEMIRFIREYEATKPKQHPIGMTGYCVPNESLWASSADWISPGNDKSYRWPGPNDGRKVILLDTDHLWGVGGYARWVWASFVRGYNPIFMDPIYVRNENRDPVHPQWIALRKAMGHTRKYAGRLDLAKTVPNTSAELCSTTLCLENPGRQYLIYQPKQGEDFFARLPAGRYVYEWFDPESGHVGQTGTVQLDGQRKLYTNVFKGRAVLFLEKADQP